MIAQEQINKILQMQLDLNAEITLLLSKNRNLTALEAKQKIKNDKDKEVNDEVKTTNILREIGVPASVRGYYYIRYAISLIIADDTIINKITKRLYPEVAEQFNSTSTKVERAIRNAIDIAWTRGNRDMIDGIFGYKTTLIKHKPTNSEFLAALADKIKMKI